MIIAPDINIREVKDMVNEPKEYDLTNPDEITRLLKEIAWYMGPSMNCRREFLKSGTDTTGREYVIEALDKIRYGTSMAQTSRYACVVCGALITKN
jgi:hypothetical protein